MTGPILPTYLEFLAAQSEKQQAAATGSPTMNFGGGIGIGMPNYGMGMGMGMGMPYYGMGMGMGMPYFGAGMQTPWMGAFGSYVSNPANRNQSNPASQEANPAQKRALKRKLKELLDLNVALSGSGAQRQFELVHNADKEGNDHVTLSVGAVAGSAGGFVAFETVPKAFSIRRRAHGKRVATRAMSSDAVLKNYADKEMFRAYEEAQQAIVESRVRLEKQRGFLRKTPLTPGQKKAVIRYQMELKEAMKAGDKVRVMQLTHDLNTASGILTGRGVLFKSNKYKGGATEQELIDHVTKSHQSDSYKNIEHEVPGKFGTKMARKNESSFRTSAKSAGGTFKGFMVFEAILRFVPDMYHAYVNGSKADMDHDGQADGFKGGMGTALRQSWQSLLGMTVSSGGYAIGNELGKAGARAATKAVLRKISKKGIANCTKWGAKIGSKAGIWGAAIGTIAGIAVGCALQLGGEKLINWLIPEQAKDEAEANILAQEQGLEGALVAAENIDQQMAANPGYRPTDYAAVQQLQRNADKYNQLMQDQQLMQLGIDPSAILNPETAQQQREQIQHMIDQLA